jgi:hypothetical protein
LGRKSCSEKTLGDSTCERDTGVVACGIEIFGGETREGETWGREHMKEKPRNA